MTLPKLHVAVLMGGWSTERPVSLMSGEGVAKALESRGHTVTRIDMGRDVALKLAEARPDVVFNALHGTPGEDGTVQGMMDLMGLTYTHSGLATSVIAIDKELTKQALVPARHSDARRADRRNRGALPARSAGAALCAQAGQRGLARSASPSSPTRATTAIRSARDAKGPWQEFDSLLAEPFIRGKRTDRPQCSATRRLLVTELKPKSRLLRFRRQVHRRHDRSHLPGRNSRG